jgi:hypothetical protein
MIGAKTAVAGSARSTAGWVEIDEARITYDHATHVWSEHALRLDLSPRSGAEPIAVELDLNSARRLAAKLAEVIGAAERVEG